MEQSLEELALLNCLPPDVLEKYFLKIVEKLDSQFFTTNYKQIAKLIESKTDIYTVIVINNYRNETTVIRDLMIEDIAEILLYTFDGWAEDELGYLTLNSMFHYLDQYVDVNNCECVPLSKNPKIKKIFDDFKKNLKEGINLHRLIGDEFSFDNGRDGGQIEIKIMKTRKDFDYFLEREHSRSNICIMEGKGSIKYALGGWWRGQQDNE